MRRDPFQAIADPNRRKIIEVLAREGALTMNRLAEHFDISRPAVSKHVKILEKSGVLDIKQVRVERFCHLNYNALKTVFEWTGGFEERWAGKPAKKEKADQPQETARKKPVADTSKKKEKPAKKKKGGDKDERDQLSLF